MIKYASLFSGIGGFEIGLANSKYNFENVFFSEVDKYATSIYIRHFPKHKNWGDVTKINTEEIPDFDFLVGGFPCQAFSYAGKRRGFDDSRGTLFFEIARILKDKQPKCFLLENVRGLLSHDKGRTFKTILEVLSSLGYNVKWSILNSKNFGVPQRRERLFIEGYSRTECGGEILSFKRTDSKTDGDNKVDNNIHQLNSTKAQAQMIYDIDGIAPSLMSNGGGQGGKTGLYCIPKEVNLELKDNIPQEFKFIDNNTMMTVTEDGDSYALCTRHRNNPLYKKMDNYVMELDKEPLKIRETTKKGYKEAYPNDGVLLNRGSRKIAKGIVRNNHCGALQTAGVWGTVTLDYRVRRLTPVECERLQGFPDNWTQYGKDDELISDTQRYKCIGNAVTTNVITWLVNHMFDEVGINES